MENSINILRSLKKERKILSNKFGDAMQQKNISKALEIKVRQDSICDEIINVYDSMIKLQIMNKTYSLLNRFFNCL